MDERFEDDVDHLPAVEPTNRRTAGAVLATRLLIGATIGVVTGLVAITLSRSSGSIGPFILCNLLGGVVAGAFGIRIALVAVGAIVLVQLGHFFVGQAVDPDPLVGIAVIVVLGISALFALVALTIGAVVTGVANESAARARTTTDPREIPD